MSASPDPAADPELERLLDEYAARVRAYALERGTVRDGLSTRAAILAHVAAQYVRRDDPRYRILDRANERMIGYKAARGILSLPACPQCGSRAVLVEEQHATLAYYPEYSDDAGSVHRGDSNARGTRYLCRRCDHRFEGAR